jgi:hypothetical protein
MKRDEESRATQVTPHTEQLPQDNSISLAGTEALELTGLTESQVSELKMQHARGMIDLKRKAEELKIDVGSLDAALGSFSDQTARATKDGTSATINHSQTTSLGRTEVVIGNTDRAARGKMSRTAAGAPDRTVLLVIIVGVAAIIVAALIGAG